MRRPSPGIVAIALVAVLALTASGAAQENKGAHFSIVTASYRSGVLSIVVKNEGDESGRGRLTVHRERMRCLEVDEDYCKENPSEDCVAPCARYETKDLGTVTADVPTVASCKEVTVEVNVPDEEAYAEITAEPGSKLGFGLEIKPRS
jgi:hypothetical protein